MPSDQWEHINPKPIGGSKSSFKREVYSNTILTQETRKALNRQYQFTPKTTKKKKQKKKEKKPQILLEGKKS